jgi:hypothetical protein
MWLGFLESSDGVALEAWKYLNNRVYWRPRQSMKLAGESSGPIEFKVTRVVTEMASPILFEWNRAISFYVRPTCTIRVCVRI